MTEPRDHVSPQDVVRHITITNGSGEEWRVPVALVREAVEQAVNERIAKSPQKPFRFSVRHVEIVAKHSEWLEVRVSGVLDLIVVGQVLSTTDSER